MRSRFTHASKVGNLNFVDLLPILVAVAGTVPAVASAALAAVKLWAARHVRQVAITVKSGDSKVEVALSSLSAADTDKIIELLAANRDEAPASRKDSPGTALPQQAQSTREAAK
ncbi:hypothetical protein Raf01_64160 [Rugosimonospora africana]|uniref:Uncharacterized protein n=1 Tax=Rugosimonospora africana TaxID=556532 RepID=A0A8J3QW74_9ACTN|nr:hypothetical protein Raf01_64160 [Rugosimonospora africana]